MKLTSSLNRPAVIVYVPVVRVRDGHHGCACPYPECSKWSFLDPATGHVANPAGCAHAFSSETFPTGLEYVMYTHDPRTP